MRNSIGLIIILVFFYIGEGLSQGESAHWSYPYGNAKSQAWLAVPPVERNVEGIFDLTSVDLSEPLIQCLCGGIFGKHRQTLIGLNQSRNNLQWVDFDLGTVENLLPRQPPGRWLQLSHLADYDRDGALDVVYSATGTTEAPQVSVYSPSKQTTLLHIQNPALREPFFVFRLGDVNYDQTPEIIVFAGQQPGLNLSLQLWNAVTGQIEWEASLPGTVEAGTVALLQDDFFESSILVLGTQPGPGGTGRIMAYEFLSGTPPQELWSQSLRSGLTAQRVAIGKTDQGEDTVVAGFRSLNPDDNVSVRTVSELSLYEGRLVNEVALSGVDCRDLSVSQLDDDEELEIVCLDGRDDFHRLDFSQNRNRILTVASAIRFVGSGDMVFSLKPENVIIQQVGTRLSIHPLSEDLDPYGNQAFLSLRANLIGRPILGDTNGNDKAEILFVTEANGIVNANRLGYYDPDAGGSAVEEWDMH